MTQEVRNQVSARWSALLDSNRFVGGEAVDRFESQWAEYCGSADAIGVANGTDALQLALRAMGIGERDEVIVPANSFVATAEAVVLAGAAPRFADVDPRTLLVTAETIEPVITRRTRAIIVVHLYGQMVDMDEICALADRLGIHVIEDAAQAHGATWRERKAGSVGRAGCFSFYPGKNLGAFGDAGAVVTSDVQLAASIRSLRDHGRAAGSHYEHAVIGTNSRLDAMQAVVLSAKLEHLDRWNLARRAIMARYRTATDGTAVQLVAESPHGRGVHHLAVARTPRRAEVRHWLDSWGIETGIHYPTPIHCFGAYQRFTDGPLPVAERAAGEILSLPLWPQMSDDQVGRVAQALELVRELLQSREAIHA
ncbi:MAG TPA: DegT/DnrJ/EryC1/StrS family aminotransferase [Jatrophihabitans sp.]|nr:DegT/DnrJ/EryC1/StrS family aminotransferase [Jatrophihabitans sp.]